MDFMVSSPGKQETHCCLPMRYFIVFTLIQTPFYFLSDSGIVWLYAQQKQTIYPSVYFFYYLSHS